ncbi:porin [Desulfuromonas sp. DDH964]|uniref:porin n=1 Tax=Desulfuromonas sp. DDH964 TaxID=1823759 RepID=UPI00082BA5B2|nr:porin [Desulfuromonas sp. DDH964]
MNRSTMKQFLIGAIALVGLAATAFPAVAGVRYEDGEKWVELGGRIQLQYHMTDPDGGEKTDTIFFRRLRPYIEGSIHKNWLGKFEFDLGKAENDNEVAIKDAYLRYSGVKDLSITIGNAQFPFSREDMTSSKKQQLVERTFVGDHNFGTPERNAGIFAHYKLLDKKLELHLAGAEANIDPDAKKLDFDTPVNANADFNQGWIFGGRVDFHPLGYMKMDQGDFKRDEIRTTISLAAFTWANDDDNNSYTDATTGLSTSTSKADVDNVNGFEVSAGFRGFGLSVDAEYNLFQAETSDSTFTGGIYKNGETELSNYALEGGYMVLPKTIELVAGYEAMDADNYAEVWTRTSFGVNWFLEKQDIKLQATYRIGSNLNGVKDKDQDELFVQAQYVF